MSKYLIILLLLLSSCLAEVSKNDDRSRDASWSENDWQLIGEEGYCKLYYKCIKTHTSGCTPVFWSVCTNGSTSVATR